MTAVDSDKNQHTLTLVLTTDQPVHLPVYLVGNFNGWKTGDAAYEMTRLDERTWQFDFSSSEGIPSRLEYKYVAGSDWDNEELDAYGNVPSNRSISFVDTVLRVEDFVPYWRRQGLAYNPAFLPIIQVISEEFVMPQLVKTRRVAALLPHDYHSSNKRYPVLYLQDGQNLFDDYAPYGTWGVDKKLALMAEKGVGDIIVVAIDHAEEERIAEFTPSIKTRFGSGEGKKYVRFLADTLKPYVDATFRTLPEPEHTGIGGSSMGALLSIYAGFMYPEVYGRLLVFSPSLWVVPNIHFHTMTLTEGFSLKMYLYGGGDESVTMLPNIRRFKTILEQQGFPVDFDVLLAIDPSGKHNEIRWGEEFPKAVEWLFFATNKSVW